MVELWDGVSRFVAQQARRYATLYPGGFEVEDLIQEAFFAVQHAAETWSEGAGGTFLTYCKRPLRWAFLTVARRRTMKQANDPLHNAASLDAPAGGDADNDPLSELVADPAAVEAFDKVEHTELSKAVQNALQALSLEERQVIDLRYFRDLTQPQAAQTMDLTEKELKRIEATALRRLRRPDLSKTLREYL